MMALRPIVVDDNMVVLGGNMRLKALIHLNYDEIPDEWIKKAVDLTDEEKDRFVIIDNVNTGEWNFEILTKHWDSSTVEDWGLNIDIKTKVFGEILDPVYPIVPKYNEKYSAVIILCTNETDESYIDTILGLELMKSYKSSSVGISKIITVDQFKKKWTAK